MKITYDPTKNAKNIAERQLPFERVLDFDWAGATIFEDVRREYPERRYVAAGYLHGRLHMLCFTPIAGGVRVISFRKANLREARQYGKSLTLDG